MYLIIKNYINMLFFFNKENEIELFSNPKRKKLKKMKNSPEHISGINSPISNINHGSLHRTQSFNLCPKVIQGLGFVC